MKDLHAPSQEIHLRVPTGLISFDGAALIWIDAILLVPAIFGIMFLPGMLRAVVGGGAAVLTILFVLYLLFRTDSAHPSHT